jgi:acetylornithine deacetylase/succinyl-diaminopimelate desuccinylase-like protein
MPEFTEYLDSHHDQFLDELKAYLRQPSIAAQNTGIREMAELTRQRLEARGFAVRILPTGGHPVVFGELGEGPKTLLIYDHYDVQPPEPLELWDSPPFEPTVRDGNLYARGVADNKGDQMCRMQAIEAWLATRGPLPCKIKWVIEGEEEIGSPNLEAFALAHADLLKADGCLWECGGRNELDQFSLWLGLKGIAYFELRLKLMETDAHSGNAPMLPNAAWRLVWALSSLKSPDDRITLDGYWEHVRTPDDVELNMVDHLPFDAHKIKSVYGVKHFINDMDASQAKRAFYFNPTLTICGLESGYTGQGSKTVLPKDARVKLDFRLVPDLTPDLVYDLLRHHLDRRGFTDIEIVRFAGEHTASSSASAGIVQAAIRASRTIYGTDPVIYPRMPGSGPMYPLSNMLGIPSVLAGITHTDSRAHAPNEHIRLQEYWLGQKFMGELIKEFATT